MERTSEAALRIQQIEAQQDEILRQLEDLERRTEMALAEHAPRPAPPPLLGATAEVAIHRASLPETL